MIDNLILTNLSNKFTRELAKGNIEEAKKIVERLEKLEKEHSNDSLGTSIYFTVRGMKVVLGNK